MLLPARRKAPGPGNSIPLHRGFPFVSIPKAEKRASDRHFPPGTVPQIGAIGNRIQI